MKKENSRVNVLARWKNREKKTSLLPVITAAPEGIKIPLSNAQRRLWFLQDLNPENSFYNFGETYNLKGNWSITNLKAGIHQLYESHDILRSSCVSGDDGIELKVSNNVPLVINEVDFSHLSDLEGWDAAKSIVHKDFTTPFDLQEAPLIRISIIKLASNYHILNITMHHIITDEWSMQVFIKQLAEHYIKSTENKDIFVDTSDIQFGDFALWDQGKIVDENELKYWKENLSGNIPVLQLQTDFKRPAKPSYKGSYKTIDFSPKLSKDILNLAKDRQVTPFVMLLSVFYTLLYRHTGQSDILVGSPISNRNQKELENLIGFFIDTLILRNSVSSETSFADLLEDVRKNTLNAFSNKDVPFDVLVKEINPVRSPSINPFFQVMFVYNEQSKKEFFGEGLVFEKSNFVNLETSKFDLTLFVSENEEVLSVSFEYATDLFKASTIDRFLEHFELLSKGAVENLNIAIGDIPMLTHKERKLFLNKEKIAHDINIDAVGIHKWFESIALKTPNATAITFGDQSMTYEELNLRSNQIAQSLLHFTKGENQIIGLCINRSLEMIVGLMAVLKSGSAYLPLDPEYPLERTKFILEDSKAQLVLTEEKYLDTFTSLGIQKINIEENFSPKNASEILLPMVQPDDLAYVIYTSGSTGKPKGVPITHKNIASSTSARFSFYEENPSAFLLLSSISFDSSKAGIFWTLCTGGNLVIAEKRLEQDMILMQEVIVKNNISHVLTLPTLYRLMLENIDSKKLESLTTVMVAGETCPSRLPDFHFQNLPNTLLFNEYGPTEATVWCIAYKISKGHSFTSIPIGKAIDGVKIHLLDKSMKHVPFGAVGEIYITGSGLSKGYLNQKELTATKFIKNPFVDIDGYSRIYRSGDLGRYLPNGNIEFLGRADSQVKLRGFRIELDEIEAVLLNYPAIVEASVVVMSKGQQFSNGILVAYVVPKPAFDIASVITFLKSELPKHMVPSKIIPLEKFETLPNGKVDKKHLQNIPLDVTHTYREKEKATTKSQKELLAIWEETLGFEGLSITDNFFEIGGDSIMTIQIIAKARKGGMAISPNQLFEYQTIEELASFVDRNNQKEDHWDYLVPLRKEGSKAPLFCIHAGGGHVFFYNKLTDHLDEDIPIYALQPSGVYGDKSMHKSVKNMTEAYLNAIRKVQPVGPYNILVYCFSAAVGNEMATLLTDRGEEINLIVMDTMTAPAVLNTPRRLRIRLASFFMRLLKSPLTTIKSMLIAKYSIWRMKWRSTHETDKEALELEKLRMNLMQLSQSYQWKKYSGKTSVILTKKDHEALNKETVRSWKELAVDGITIIKTAGSHQLLFDEPYVKHTAKAIEKCMFKE